MTNEDLRAAIEAALRRRDPCANVCSGDAPDGFSGRDASALVMHGYAASRGDSDDEALRRLARLVGLRDDGSDPAEEVERLRAELALERDRCAGLVRELTSAPPGSRRTAASRNLAERVAACVRGILRDDETANCARSLVREARGRAKAEEADVARLLAELDALRATHEATAQAFDDLVVRVWRAATGDTHEGPASVDALIEAVERRAAARMEPMTDAALDAACAAEDRATADDLLLDGTDGAHPAWWRGHDRAAEVWSGRVDELTRERDEARADAERAREAYAINLAGLRDALRRADDDRAKWRAELDEARAAFCADRCDECLDRATRVHTPTGDKCCDAHGIGEGWADMAHAAAVRAAVTR